MNITLPGDLGSALTHLMLIGIASILEDGGVAHVTVRWDDGAAARPTVGGEVDSTVALAGVLLDHAERHSKPDSWVQATFSHMGVETGTMSPRIKTPATPVDWENLYEARRAILNRPLTPLDTMMIAALGQPAYWRLAPKPEPDQGASRWEMKTRNQGQEFVKDRLATLAAAVAARPIEKIAAALEGRLWLDEQTKDSAASRTSTGLTRPGPTDSLIAWCALWGLASIPLVTRTDAYAQTPGAFPRTRVAPDYMALPVPERAMTPARWRRVVSSDAYDVAAFEGLRRDASSAKIAAARGQLSTWGVGNVVRFPVIKAGSTSAPERQLGMGSLVPIGDE